MWTQREGEGIGIDRDRNRRGIGIDMASRGETPPDKAIQQAWNSIMKDGVGFGINYTQFPSVQVILSQCSNFGPSLNSLSTI